MRLSSRMGDADFNPMLVSKAIVKQNGKKLFNCFFVDTDADIAWCHIKDKEGNIKMHNGCQAYEEFAGGITLTFKE